MKHMKKIVIGILVVLMGLTAALSLVACGGDIYGGNFKEVTDEAKISQILEDVETALEKLDKWTAVKISISMKGKFENVDNEIKATLCMTPPEDGVPSKMSMELSSTVDGKKESLNLYFKDGVAYVNATADGKTEKTKTDTEGSGKAAGLLIGTLLGAYGLDMDMLNPNENIDNFMDFDFKVFITAETGARNIKFTSDNGGSQTLIISLDKDGNLKGIKMESIRTNMEGSLIFEKISEIKFPNDLNSYVESPLDI